MNTMKCVTTTQQGEAGQIENNTKDPFLSMCRHGLPSLTLIHPGDKQELQQDCVDNRDGRKLGWKCPGKFISDSL